MLSHRCIVNECLGPWAVSVGRGSWSVAWVSSRGGVHINSDQNQSHGSSPTDPWDRLHCERSVTDVEGTTTSIDFVTNTLFAYSERHVGEFIDELVRSKKRRTPEQKELLNDLIKLVAAGDDAVYLDEDDNATKIHKITESVLHWIQEDKKYTALKTLQGEIWEKGYADGHLKAHVFPDVPKAFQRLFEQEEKRIYIFSSGSVKAQQDLFKHTNYGDLTKYISAYYDTNVGSKKEPQSYLAICANMHRPPQDVLFLTDVEAEAKAASEAGLKVRLVVREGNKPVSNHAMLEYGSIRSFDELFHKEDKK